MYADLGVGIASPFDARKAVPLLEAAQRLGYGVVALTETVEAPLKAAKHVRLCVTCLRPPPSEQLD